MNSIFEETNFIMKKYNIKANKSLGQNFLINEDVIDGIVDSADIDGEDLIIEIGPGLEKKKKRLLDKAGKVICVELDEKMIKNLRDRFAFYNNLEILNQDILKTNLKQIIKDEKNTGKIKRAKVVANLPYYITTPIIMKLLEEELDLESITVMIQKEVADRLIAIPGEKNTGAITYTVYYYAKSEKIMEVPNSSFIPEPEVTSEVIRLNIRKEPPVNVNDINLMFKVIKNAFMQRRKTLLNSLFNTKIFKSKNQGMEVLKNIGLKENVRAEELSLEKFAELTEVLLQLNEE